MRKLSSCRASVHGFLFSILEDDLHAVVVFDEEGLERHLKSSIAFLDLLASFSRAFDTSKRHKCDVDVELEMLVSADGRSSSLQSCNKPNKPHRAV